MQAGCGQHVDQGVDGEQVDLAAHQIGNAGLGDAEQCGGTGLREVLGLDVLSMCSLRAIISRDRSRMFSA